MPIIYPARIRRKFHSLNLEKVKESLNNKGFIFIREGGFRPEDKPFKYSNYLFYQHQETKMAVRIGYDYPLFGNRNLIFEICYATPEMQWWRDVTPDFHKAIWKEISDWYKKENNKFIKIK